MRLAGLSLETAFFEDYLSFLTEVLELELQELTDISMLLNLQGTLLEIKKSPNSSHQVASTIEFSLEQEEYNALVQKLSFFYYRRDSSRFLYLGNEEGKCDVVDPDGRIWRFKEAFSFASPKNELIHVRNY
jgi:hypothetical protein